MTLKEKLRSDQLYLVCEIISGNKSLYDDDCSDLYDFLFQYYSEDGEMPYGTMKARDGDPYEWITNKLYHEFN